MTSKILNEMEYGLKPFPDYLNYYGIKAVVIDNKKLNGFSQNLNFVFT